MDLKKIGGKKMRTQGKLGIFLLKTLIKVGLVNDYRVKAAFIDSQIPKNSLSFQEILDEIKKMKSGETKAFNYNPKDKKVKEQRLWTIFFADVHKKPVWINYSIRPLDGIYEVEVTLLG